MAKIIFAILLLAPLALNNRIQNLNRIRIWQSPQGQMISWIRQHECLHFDVGGTKEDWNQILRLCHNKTQFVFISHRDREHTRLINRFKDWGAAINQPHPDVEIWQPGQLKPKQTKSGAPMSKSEREDQKSRVFFLKAPRLLITGDSPREQETEFADWAHARDPKILILGSHGRSRSTSEFLLKRLTNLQLTIASSRRHHRPTSRQKFIYSNHVPKRSRLDLKTKRLLTKNKLPVLGTHDWGTLEIVVSY